MDYRDYKRKYKSHINHTQYTQNTLLSCNLTFNAAQLIIKNFVTTKNNKNLFTVVKSHQQTKFYLFI